MAQLSMCKALLIIIGAITKSFYLLRVCISLTIERYKDVSEKDEIIRIPKLTDGEDVDRRGVPRCTLGSHTEGTDLIECVEKAVIGTGAAAVEGLPTLNHTQWSLQNKRKIITVVALDSQTCGLIIVIQ